MKSKNKIFENYRDDESLRKEFHHFISVVFPSISFEEWYKKGFWTNQYIPFSIKRSGKIVSNASVTFMNILINGQKHKAIQIGAVGTLPEFRNQGLSREILNYVINKYKDQIDFFFLFANEAVLEFYPKFGFKKVEENIFVLDSNLPESHYSARKLNINVEGDYLLVNELINSQQILTNTFGAEDYGFITMWHILNLYPDNLFYLSEEDVIIIKKEKNNVLQVLDVIYRRSFDINTALSKTIISESIKSIKYYFAPDQLRFKYDHVLNEETGLFVLGDIELGNNFFRFPPTAIT